VVVTFFFLKAFCLKPPTARSPIRSTNTTYYQVQTSQATMEQRVLMPVWDQLARGDEIPVSYNKVANKHDLQQALNMYSQKPDTSPNHTTVAGHRPIPLMLVSAEGWRGHGFHFGPPQQSMVVINVQGSRKLVVRSGQCPNAACC
jgi:hypothetical protein